MALSKIAVTSADFPSGSVLQVQSTVLTTAIVKASSSTNAFVDLDLSVNITPLSSSSKILIMVNASFSYSIGTGHIRLVRGSTAICVGDAASNRLQSSSSIRDAGTPYTHNIQNLSINFLDTPSTTNTTTYKIQGTLGSTYSGSVYLNRTPSDVDADYGPRPASTITVTEIAG